LKVDVSVESQEKHENADKEPKYKVSLLGITKELVNVKLVISSEDEHLLEEYPLKESFAINLTKPQQKIAEA
jgi:hypothetical protein